MASLVWGCCRLIGAMPHWLRYYVLQDTIYFIVYKCLRYRVGVVTENLRNSFPDRPMAEIKRIRRSFYHNLSEIFISTVSQAAMSDDDCRRRVRVKNLDEVLSDLRGRDALLSTAHFGCWEYDSFLALYTGEHYLAAVYHPLENKVIDAVYMRLRRRRNIRLIPMKEIIRYYIDHRLPAGAPGQRIGIGLIADQNPPLRPNSHWFRFLNQDTVFFDGIEKMALKFHMPVYFCRQRRLRRGYYELEFLRLYDGARALVGNGIPLRQLIETGIFATLERMKFGLGEGTAPEEFEKQNPVYVAGKSSYDLLRIMLPLLPCDEVPAPELRYDRTPDFWAGWALAQYQMTTGCSYRSIFATATYDEIRSMYWPLHEAPESKFVAIFDEMRTERAKATNLRTLREAAGLSQSQLAKASGVGVRSIQLYEQRQKDINKAQGIALYRLSRALRCTMEQLLER